MQQQVGGDPGRESRRRAARERQGPLRWRPRALAFRRWLRRPAARWTAIGGVLALLVLGIGAALLLGGGPRAASTPSATAAASPTSTGTPSPTAAPTEGADWTALTLPPYEPVAELAAGEADGSGVATDGTFTLTSLTSTPAVELASGLVVEPPVELAVEPGPASDTASVRPATPLVENARYEFRLYDPTGVLAGSWTFRTSGPLDVVRRLPENRSNGVPVDTGIEVEFDQASLVGVEERFSIDPPVAGSIEAHGRTWAFVPDGPLEPATLYTVTVAAGVAVADSDVVLESDVRFAFETEGPEVAGEVIRVLFEGPMREVRPNEAPIIPLDHWGGSQQAGTVTRRVTLYELTTLDAALDIVRNLAVDRSWVHMATNAGVDPSGLPEVGAWDVEVSLATPGQHFQLPTGLGAGWYLLHLAQEGRPAQIVLQVTDLSAYVMASETRTIAWVNDVASSAPLPAAELLLDDGTVLGSADAAGLVDVQTPDELESPASPDSGRLLLIAAPDGRRIIATLEQEQAWYWPGGGATSSTWWTLLDTDRSQYHSMDTIHAWGLVRSRADRAVPGDLELRVGSGDGSGPPIARASVTASERGVFIGDLPLRDVPPGGYTVGLYAGESAVTQTWITVTEIRKPTFRIDVSTDRRAYIAGDEVTVDVTADFFDGSTAPGLQLRVMGSIVDGEGSALTLDATGSAQLRYPATTSSPSVEWSSIGAEGAEPQEGLSAGSTDFVVYPSAAWIAGEAELEDETVTVTGRLTSVDLDRVESEAARGGWIEDPSGEPLAGGAVEIAARRINWNEVQIGTTYDFIEKRAVPVYRQEREVVPLGMFSATAAADGAFRLSIPVPQGAGGIELTLSAVDEAGRRVELPLWAERNRPSETASASYPYLEQRTFCMAAQRPAEIGETVTLTVRGADDEPSVEGRTLFVFSQAGIQRTEVTAGAEASMRFDEADVPSITVRAIRLIDGGYVLLNEVDVVVEPEAKAIEVELIAGAERYAPGDEVSVAVRTIGPDGAPIAADVVVEAVDLKLYEIFAAQEPTVGRLMARAPSGSLGAYASHAVPSPASDCGFGAATGGGEPRTEFRDVATFQRITTGSDGTASVTFDAPDDLTSWRVSAVAFGDLLEAGTETVDVPVGLPFFVDATIAPEYLVGEEPVVLLRAYGDALAAGDTIRFTVDAPSLGIEDATFEGVAFARVRAPLPALPLGDHEVTIAAERAGGDDELADALVRTVRVVPTRLRTVRTAHQTVEAALSPPGGDGMTTHVVTDAGRGGLYPVLQELAWSRSARFDAQLAASMARELLIEELAIDEATLPPGDPPPFEGHPPEGLALLPYGSADLYLTARAALVAGDRLPPAYLREALTAALNADPTRERGIVALAGLAGLGDDVAAELRALDAADLPLRERAWLALGLLAAGDEEGARAIERAILGEHGQRLGAWVRLDIGTDTPEAAEVSASVLLLAAGLRDPIAADLSRYLVDNPSTEYLPALEQIGFARLAVEWLPRETAEFAWTVDGQRHEEALEPGAAFTLRVTPAQGAALTIEPVVGSISVASSWEGDAAYDELPSDPSVGISRVVTPAGRAPADGLVRVTLNVAFDDPPASGCYQVTDLVPSGLAPLTASLAYWSADAATDVIQPYEVEGNRVSWCIGTDRPAVRLGYTARIVSAGTYRWEPAVIQAVAAPTIGSATDGGTYEID